MLGCNEQIFECEDPDIEPESHLLIRVNASLSETDSIRIFVQAQVTMVDDPDSFLNGQIDVGDEVSCSYLYDPTCSDSRNNKTIGQYIFDVPPYGMNILINSLVFRSDSTSVDMTILLKDNAHKQGLHDQYKVSSSNNLEVLPGVGVSEMIILLEDLDAGALSSDALMDSDLDLLDWPAIHELAITGNDGWTISANINAISANPIVTASEERSKTKDKFQRQ